MYGDSTTPVVPPASALSRAEQVGAVGEGEGTEYKKPQVVP